MATRGRFSAVLQIVEDSGESAPQDLPRLADRIGSTLDDGSAQRVLDRLVAISGSEN
jgi:hypothetical protein